MGKSRKSKRQLVRDEKRKKKRDRDLVEEEEEPEVPEAKRQRRQAENHNLDFISLDDDVPMGDGGPSRDRPEKEFFGMLADEEQEYFRHADELLELNDFPSPDDRAIFLQNVYKEAEGKELKLASSQSCSRLMERLILLSNTRQKKHLFEQFAGHFVTLVTHRFASHCCEKLFLQSAPVVTEELGGAPADPPSDSDEAEEKLQSSMEDLFLLMLDELEEHLSFLLSDRYASHTLRVLLVILSGRPIDQISTKSLLQSKKKEHITVAGAQAMAGNELSSSLRAVPGSFNMAIKKIIADSTSTMDPTALRILANHPTGNPVLQLLLELDISLNTKSKEAEADDATETTSLLERLVPGAPASFKDADSSASEFVNTMVYDPIGSRLLETLITHSPGKIFKGLQANYFGPRIHSLLRNDIASYSAIRVLNRLSREDLVDAVHKSLPHVPLFVEKGRFNVLKTLFERCQIRKAKAEIDSLLNAVTEALGNDVENLVPKLCALDEEVEDSRQKDFQQDSKNKSALVSHGSQLVGTMLSIPGHPSKAIQTSLLSLSSEQMLHLATSSAPTATILTNAFTSPSQGMGFHKALVASLVPHIIKLVNSQHGQKVLNAIINTPSKGEAISVPFHLKEVIVSQLADHEKEIRESWTGRNVWRTWKGDLWNHRKTEWIKWAKEADPEGTRQAAAPKPRHGGRWDGTWKRQGVGMDRGKGAMVTTM